MPPDPGDTATLNGEPRRLIIREQTDRDPCALDRIALLSVIKQAGFSARD